MATMSIELYPTEHRSMQMLVMGLMWALSAGSMAPIAFLLRNHSWRHLQYTLSAVSFLVCVLQLWHVDESLRWLMANGRREEAVQILKRAARVNKKDVHTVLNSLNSSESGPCSNAVHHVELSDVTSNKRDYSKDETETERRQEENNIPHHHPEETETETETRQEENHIAHHPPEETDTETMQEENHIAHHPPEETETMQEENHIVHHPPEETETETRQEENHIPPPPPEETETETETRQEEKHIPHHPPEETETGQEEPHLPYYPPGQDKEGETAGKERQAERLTLLDIFRHRILLLHAGVIWLAWFTVAFSYFSLFMMSTTLYGGRFINYFLATMMDLPSSPLTFCLVDKLGRRKTSCGFLLLTAFGLISCAVFRLFSGSAVMGTLSVVSNSIGVLGAGSAFGLAFFFTPEMFPTNMRSQALGVSSFAGRLGGMMGPFMTDLAEIAVWAPGALVGTLCVMVATLFRFLPETTGRELPHTISDIKAWKAAKPAEQKYSNTRL